MEDRKTFKYQDKEFEILYTFRSIKTKNDYIIYTDNTYEDNSLNIYASIYYPKNPDKELKNIETEEEWNEVEVFLDNMSGDKNE